MKFRLTEQDIVNMVDNAVNKVLNEEGVRSVGGLADLNDALVTIHKIYPDEIIISKANGNDRSRVVKVFKILTGVFTDTINDWCLDGNGTSLNIGDTLRSYGWRRSEYMPSYAKTFGYRKSYEKNGVFICLKSVTDQQWFANEFENQPELDTCKNVGVNIEECQDDESINLNFIRIAVIME